MANQRHNPMKNSGGAPTGQRVPKKDSLNEATPNWPGNPGKTGPDRSNGVEKARIYPKQEGL